MGVGLVADVGPEATTRFFEFFMVPVRNKNTRIVYYHAIGEFLAWSQRCGFLSLEDIEVHPMPCANDRLRNSTKRRSLPRKKMLRNFVAFVF